MSAALPQNRLRLVGLDDPPVAPRRKSVLVAAPDVRLAGRSTQKPVPPSATSAEEIAAANLHAARMSALDARWVLAVQVDRALQGGKAAIITPESRTRLLALAERVGLRPFDASLVIAVVQDAARQGEDPLGPLAVDRLRLVRAGDASPLYAPKPAHTPWIFAALVVITLSAALAFALSRWLVS
jgi:hypothetical protein